MATFAIAACWCGGCTSASRMREPQPLRRIFTSANGQATVVVHGGFGAFETGTTSQSSFQNFIYGPEPTFARRLRTPQGLATDGLLLWVCDQGYPDVFRVDPGDGTFQTVSTRTHRPASPIAVAVDGNSNVLVADATRRSVMVYGPDRSLLRDLAPDATFEPTALSIRDNLLVVADRGNRNLGRYDLVEQTWLTPFAPPIDQPALAVPAGLAWTPDGVLLVTDALLGVVHRVAFDGKWLAPLGSRGRGAGQLVRPIGVCCTPDGLIVVADSARQAVVVYDPAGRHVIDIERNETASPGWTLPTAVACLKERPSLPELGTEEWEGNEWIVVSDMLGANGLTLIQLRYGSSAGKENGS